MASWLGLLSRLRNKLISASQSAAARAALLARLLRLQAWPCLAGCGRHGKPDAKGQAFRAPAAPEVDGWCGPRACAVQDIIVKVDRCFVRLSGHHVLSCAPTAKATPGAGTGMLPNACAAAAMDNARVYSLLGDMSGAACNKRKRLIRLIYF